jgi:adenylate cyclase
MLFDLLNNQAARLARITAGPEDSQEEVLQKSLMTMASILFIFAGLIWGTIYVLFNEPQAGLIPLVYSIISLFSLVYFAITRRFAVYRLSQLALILLCPFFLMLVLGGFTNSSAVILWSMVAPFGAILFAHLKQAPIWLIAYLVLLLLSGAFQSFVRSQNNLPPQLITGFFVLNIGVVSTIAFILVYYFVRGKNKALKLLDIERDKSERLLLNVLPKQIATILKENENVIADHYESASVLFADIVGFTRLSTEMTPEEMVGLLNEIFSHFDTLVDKYRLEKIRTIGDNYMVASGVPISRIDHAHALANMALEMMEFVGEHPICREKNIQFRVGMNSGPMVAGVIGKQKFHYDIWGDTVNTASRMESNGVPDKIQITEATFKIIQDDFICTPRGIVEIKSKGSMHTWFLETHKDSLTQQVHPH